MSAGSRFLEALAVEKPLQIPGTINAYSALMAEKSGYKAIYLSGGGSSIVGLCDLIQDRLQLDSTVFNPFSGMDMKEELLEGDPSQYSIAAGLAIRGCSQS